MMVIRNYSSTELMDNPQNIDARKLYEADHAVIIHLQLPAGHRVLPHEAPMDIVFYVLEGSPHITIGEDSRRLNPDDLVESKKGSLNSLRNETNGMARILVHKFPGT